MDVLGSDLHVRGRHFKFSVANWKNRPTSFDLLSKVVQGQFFLGHLLTPRWVRQKRNLGSRVMGTWRNRHPGSGLIPARCNWFRSSSSEILPNSHRISSQVGPIFRPMVNLTASGWNQKGSGYLFLHVPPTLAPNFIFQWTVLTVQNWPKNCWPWMTFLSRSNTGRQFFQFATEEFKCRPLMSCRNQTRQNIQLRKSGGVITLHFLSILISCNIPHKLVFSIQCKEKIISSEIPFTFQWNSIQSNFLYPPNQKVTVNVLLVCHSIEINLVSHRNVNFFHHLTIPAIQEAQK